MQVPARDATAEIREKKSRFLAFVRRVGSEDEARHAVAGLETEYRDASHVCFAWRLGEDPVERSSDAGEPAGTAGRPILDAIRERGLEGCVVAVVRWFGGTKLGKGGLARAYREAARAALEAAGAREVRALSILRFEVDAASAGRIGSVVAQAGGSVVEETWEGERAVFAARVPRESEQELRDILGHATAGSVRFEDGS